MAMAKMFSAIDIEGIRVDSYVTLKDGHGTLVKLCQSDGSPLIYQTPIQQLSWNIQARVQDRGQVTCNLPLSFGSSGPGVAEFEAWLTSLREKVKELLLPAIATSYGSALTAQQIADYLGPIIKDPPPDTTYSRVFLPKVAATDDGSGDYRLGVPTYAVDKSKLVPEDVLKKGARVGAIIKVPYVHVGRGNKQLSIRSDVLECVVLPVASEQSFSFDLSAPGLAEAAAEAQRLSEQAVETAERTKKRRLEEASSTENFAFNTDGPEYGGGGGGGRGMAETDGADDV